MQTNCTKTGVIVNCLWAPIRVKSNNDSHIICEIGCLSEVQVHEDKSIDQFYFVRTESGDEGYCLKDYIVLRK